MKTSILQVKFMFRSKLHLLWQLLVEVQRFAIQIFSFGLSRGDKKLSLLRIVEIICRLLDANFITRLLVGLDGPTESWGQYSLSDVFRLSTDYEEQFKQAGLCAAVIGKGEVRRALMANRVLRLGNYSVENLVFVPAVGLEVLKSRNLWAFDRMGIDPSKSFIIFDQGNPLLSAGVIKEIDATFAGYYVCRSVGTFYASSSFSPDDCLIALLSAGKVQTITVIGSVAGERFLKKFRRLLMSINVNSRLVAAGHDRFGPNVGASVNRDLYDEIYFINDTDDQGDPSCAGTPLLKNEKSINYSDYPSTVGTDNHEKIAGWVIEALKALPTGARLLDAGAGERRYRTYCEHLQYVSQDFNQYDGQGDGSGLQTEKWSRDSIDIVSDIAEIPVPDGSFDAVLCTEVIEHVADPVRVIAELARVLRKGGTLILTAPFCSLTHFAPYHYSSGFNRYFYDYHLRRYGLSPKLIKPNGGYFDFLSQEIRRVPSIAEKYTSIKLPFSAEAASTALIDHLAKLKERDAQSSELLCYGYFVVAEKL